MKIKKLLDWKNEYENNLYEDCIVDESGFEIFELDLEDGKEKFVFKIDWYRSGDYDIEMIFGEINGKYDNVDIEIEDMEKFIMENR